MTIQTLGPPAVQLKSVAQSYDEFHKFEVDFNESTNGISPWNSTLILRNFIGQIIFVISCVCILPFGTMLHDSWD